jgi:hypothetical protein
VHTIKTFLEEKEKKQQEYLNSPQSSDEDSFTAINYDEKGGLP